MNKKRLVWTLYILIFLVSIGTAIAASKPIAGFVFKNDSGPAQNATIVVYVNTTFPSVNPCYILPSVYSGGDGSFATNLANLKRADNDQDCSGLWTTGDPIWAEADGSTVIPTPQGNGSISGDTIASGTGLQYLSNMTLAAGPDISPPLINLISPPDGNTSETGNVIFKYNVTDNSNIANCSLIFNETINETNTSITKNIEQNFTKTNLPDGIYNWSVNCTDVNGNQNTSEFRILNVSKIGSLQAMLITPLTDTQVNKNDFFEFTTQVTCLNGKCGNVNASLDPLTYPQEKEEEPFISSMFSFFKKIGNLITGFAAGNLIPTTPTEPFWTNSSNPADLNDFACLSNMAAGSSCNITWWVNASGNVGTKSEFFAFFNSTTYSQLSNETSHINITIVDLINPSVINLTAIPPVINQTQTTNTTADITDNLQVDNATINITYPNSSVVNYQMIKNGGDIWYYEFTPTINDPPGTYTARLIANDTSGNVNSSETTTFNVSDVTAPTWSNNKTNPTSPAAYTTNYQFNVTWQDNIAVDTVQIEHNFTGILVNYSVTGNVSSEYYYNYSSLTVGSYVWRMYANDTSGNTNVTDQWIHIVTKVAPEINLTLNGVDDNLTVESGTTVTFNVSLTPLNGFAYLYENNSLLKNATTPFSYSKQYITPATYEIKANYSGNENYTNSSETHYLIVNDTTSPNVTIITPLDFDIVGWTVLLRANVTDYSLANVTYEIRNGTLTAPVIASGYMNNVGGDIYNATLVTNASWPYNNTILNSTNLTFVVYANDTSGNSANASTYWILDNTKPNIQHVTPPQSGAFYNSNFTLNIWLSNTLLNYSEYNITNSTGSLMQTNSTNLSSTTYTWSDFVDVDALPDGNYTLTTYARDYIGNNNTKQTWFYIDKTPPNVTEVNETGWIPPTPANNTYTNVPTHTFNMTCNESFIDTVWIDFNGTINTTPQNTGTAYWWTFTLAEGTYTYTGYCNDTVGNNASTETRILNIDTSPPYWSNNKTSPVSPATYSPGADYQFNITWQDNYGIDTVLFEHNFSGSLANYSTSGSVGSEYYYNYSDLTVGTYFWRSYANDTAGNENQSDGWTYVVNKATPTCSLIFNPVSPSTYGIQLNVSCSCTNPETTEQLWRNGTDVTATENGTLVTLPGGNWYYVCNVSETGNYTPAEDDDWINITKASTNVTLYINGSTGDFTQNVSFDANITCVLNISGNVNITQNGSQIAYGASPLENISTYSTPSNYSINCSYAGNENYSVSNDSSIIQAVDEDSLNVILEYPAAGYWNDTSDPYAINFNCSATDNYNLRNISLWITNNQNISFGLNQSSLITGTSNSSNWTLSLSNGNYTWNCLAYDSSGNSDWGNDNFTIVINVSAPNTPPTAPVVNVTPKDATTVDDLLCNITVNSTDADSDDINYYFRWHNGSEFVVVFGSTSDTQHILKSGNTSKNQHWNCSVVPYDGVDNGTISWDNVTIMNSPPVSTTIPNQKWLINTNKTDAFDVDNYFTDADDDILNYSYANVTNITTQVDSNNSVTFVPDINFFGKRYITFYANDSENTTSSNNVTLHVYKCGDGTCDSVESCSSCPSDCGDCPPGGGGGGGGGGPPPEEEEVPEEEIEVPEEIPEIEKVKEIDLKIISYPESVNIKDDEFIISAEVENTGEALLEDVSIGIEISEGWSSETVEVGNLEISEKKTMEIKVKNEVCTSDYIVINPSLKLELIAKEKDVSDDEELNVNINVPELSVLTDRKAYSEGDMMGTCIIYNNAGNEKKDKLEFEFGILYEEYYILDYFSPYSVDEDKILVVTRDYSLIDIPVTGNYVVDVKMYRKGSLFSEKYLIVEDSNKVFLNGFIEDRILKGEGERYEFMYRQDEHIIQVDNVDENFVDLRVSSDPEDYRIILLETVHVDLDKDGLNDLEMVYLGELGGKADLRLRLIPKEPRAIVGSAHHILDWGETVSRKPTEIRETSIILVLVTWSIAILIMLLIMIINKSRHYHRIKKSDRFKYK